MKKDQIKVGGLYTARVNGRYTTVRVDAIKSNDWHAEKVSLRYDVTNLATGRKTRFRSAAKFREEVTIQQVENQLRNDELGQILTSALSEVETVESDEDVVEGEQSLPFVSASARTPPVPFTAGHIGAMLQDPSVEDCGTITTVPCESSPPVAGSVPPTSPQTGLASRIAAHRAPAASVAGFVPTDEQRAILDAVAGIRDGVGPRVLVIEAGAGAGKTSTLRMLEEVLPGRGQYTAFNKSLVEDSRPKFRRAKCNTTHSLAFGPCGRDYQHRLKSERVRGHEVARMLGIEAYKVDTGLKGPKPDKKPVIKTLEPGYLASHVKLALQKFSSSADREVGEHHFHYIAGIDQPGEGGRRGWENNNAVRQYLLPFARKAWEDIEKKDGSFPFTHDYYVKIWQLASPVISADYILLDEDQDTAPVFADIVRRQTNSILILVGDENQAIYEWRGAVNAAKLFPDAPMCYLTQSFRFGQRVADVANAVLATLDEPTKLRMRGLPSRDTKVFLEERDDTEYDLDVRVGKVCYLYRTNAGALGRLLRGFTEGKRGCLIGKVDAVLSFVEGAESLQRGQRTSNPELAVFESWQEVQKYAKEDPDGADLQLMVKIVDDFRCEPIIRVLRGMPKEEYADFVCSTAHKSKGREWDTVVLGQDFPPACKMTDPDRRLLYVAATRAKLVLDLSVCTPFHPYTDKEGTRTPGIEVTFTESPEQVEEEGEESSDPTTSIPMQTGVRSAERTETNAGATTTSSDFHKDARRTENTWSKGRDGWLVRGVPGQTGRVRVYRKDGSSKEVDIEKQVWTDNEVSLYEVIQ